MESTEEQIRSSKFEKFQLVEVNRDQIKAAPYNPRQMTDKAKKNLRSHIKRVGLVEPLVWNVRTGNLVGGHQRLGQLDVLEGNRQYKLHVAQVDLDEMAEKELNIALNNPENQGDWDLEKLESLIKVDQISIENAGFDVGGVYQLFGDTPLIEQPEQLQKMADAIRRVKEAEAEARESLNDRDDVNYYMVVVFRDHKSRLTFTQSLGLPDNRFVDGKHLQKLILKGE